MSNWVSNGETEAVWKGAGRQHQNTVRQDKYILGFYSAWGGMTVVDNNLLKLHEEQEERKLKALNIKQ